VTLFKRHLGAIDIHKSRAAAAAVQWWVQRSPTQHFFIAYDNGKAAAAVTPPYPPLPLSVHEWCQVPAANQPSPSEPLFGNRIL
jgi:hypothetical protein